MDISYLLRILARRKWVILSAMLAAAVTTFFLIGRKPQRYKATVTLATGIVNYKGINSDNDDAFVQQYQIENAFANLIEFVHSRSSLKLLTVEMLGHDLAAKFAGTPPQPFRQANKKLVDFSDEEEKKLYAEIKKLRLDSLGEPSFSQEFDYLLDKISRSYGYDHDQLFKSLTIKRRGNTDYLVIDLTTNNPQLSQYMANTFVQRFRNYYQYLRDREKRQKVDFLRKQSADKKRVVDSIQNALYDYMYRHRIPALPEQNRALATELTELQISKQKAESKRRAAGESVGVLEDAISDKRKIGAGEKRDRVADKATTDEKLGRVRELAQKSAETGGKDPETERELAEARSELSRWLKRSAPNERSERQTDESRRTKEELYKDRVDTDIDRIEAEKSLEDINDRIGAIYSKLSANVTSDEVTTKLNMDLNNAQDAFQSTYKQFIDAELAVNKSENPLTIVENAQLPEWPEPDRQVLISIFAAIVVGTFTTIAIFFLAYFDNTLQTPDVFKKYSEGLPLLGAVAHVPVKGLDLNVVFSSNGEMPQYTAFRESLRKIRSQIVHSGQHIFLVVSAKPGEGKTFVLHGLAYSLAANNKKVLLLDTNFKTPLPEAYICQPTPNSAILNKIITDHGLEGVFELKNAPDSPPSKEQRVDILGNTGLHKSPSELLDAEQFRHFLNDLRTHYDYIFLESAALNQYSDAQELVSFADRVIAVFNAGSAIQNADKMSVEYLKNLGDRFAGSILTGVDERNVG